jgi:hypothetical protein
LIVVAHDDDHTHAAGDAGRAEYIFGTPVTRDSAP